MKLLSNLSTDIRQYLMITGNYWAFTLTDGALRMLVVLHFHNLGYTPLQIALLFLFYEFFGVVTNLLGGWLGARIGLNRTMNIGLGLQIVALSMLLVPASWLTVPWVMAAQAMSGIAKDLNKMSAKSAIKLLVPDDAQGQLYKWVAILTGSKNTLKGVGFFLGAGLLAAFGFQTAVASMAIVLAVVWLLSIFRLKKDLGRSRSKSKFKQLFAKSSEINYLSAARLFLFSARDIWFVVALPVYLAATFGWSHWAVGGFLASWVIGYGFIQSIAPKLTGLNDNKAAQSSSTAFWTMILAVIPAGIAFMLGHHLYPQAVLIVGLAVFGFFFAINSSLHSYLIVSFASRDGVSQDVGFYYMANAAGRLFGTVLSGGVFQLYGLEACLWISSIFILIASLLSSRLSR
ncbi:MAG: organoarsenical effux MFS transporter ArsJ [Cellvibrionaceae bacterium]